MIKRVISVILSLAVLAVFIGLGTWQVQRLAWKQGILAEIEARIADAPVAVPRAPDQTRDAYLPVEAVGEVLPGELHVLVSSRDFGAGFRIIAPLLLSDGRIVLLDRGFVLAANKDQERSLGLVEVTGNLHWPDERNGSTPDDDEAGNWWYARDIAKMADALGADPVLIIARSQTAQGVLPLPITTEAIPNRHLEYAVTWFLMATVWVMMTGFAVWRIRRRNG
ncbi:MAG: SURF1 family protein [Maritimibacter sp.]